MSFRRWLALIFVLGGCTVAREPRPGERAVELAWPRDHPRVRLEKVIQVRGDAKGGGLIAWLTGTRQEPLFQRPYAVAWDGEDLLVADPGASRVVRIDARGRFSATPPGLLEEPMGVAACAQGVVVTAPRSGKVLLLERSLKAGRAIAGGMERPTGVACAGRRVVVVETGAQRIVVLEADGSRRTLGRRGEGPGEFNFPAALTLSDGTLWVGDTLNFRVQRIELESGRFVGSFGALGDSPGEMPRLKGLAVDGQGHLWVSDAQLDQVAIFDADGTFLMDLGRNGAEPGEFSFPAGIGVSAGGSIAVADSLNRRVQIFRLVNPGERRNAD